MVVNPNIREQSATMAPPKGMVALSAEATSAVLISPLCHTPAMTTVTAVMEQTTIVSMKTPIIEIYPCRTGLLVCAALWAMPALPRPASLEMTPRRMPY